MATAGDVAEASALPKGAGTEGPRASPDVAGRQGEPSLPGQDAPSRRSAEADEGDQVDKSSADGDSAQDRVGDKRPRPKKGTYTVDNGTPRPKKRRNTRGRRAKKRQVLVDSEESDDEEAEETQDQKDEEPAKDHTNVLKQKAGMANVVPTEGADTLLPFVDIPPRIASRHAKNAKVSRLELIKKRAAKVLPDFSSLVPQEHQSYDFIEQNVWEMIEVAIDEYYARDGVKTLGDKDLARRPLKNFTDQECELLMAASCQKYAA